MFEEYIGNEYLRAGAIFIGVFLVVRILLFVLTRIIPVFTAKTKTDLDDVLLKKISMPLTVLAVLVGFRIALGEFNIVEGVFVTIDGIFMTLIILAASVIVYYVVDAVVTIGYRDFGKKIKGKVNESLLQFFHSLLKIIVMVGAFLVVLASWGIEIGPLLAGLGVAGIAIAFALQSTLANVFGGISMLLDRSINVGDVVELDDGTRGHIDKINLRSTKIRTFNNKLMIVPNGKLSESNIKNVALPGPETRVVVDFGVAYGSDVSKVKKIVAKELTKIKGYFKDKGVVVRMMKMADSALEFKAYFYMENFEDILTATDEANCRIYDALNKAKITIPFPQMDVHLKK